MSVLFKREIAEVDLRLLEIFTNRRDVAVDKSLRLIIKNENSILSTHIDGTVIVQAPKRNFKIREIGPDISG